MAAPKKAFTAQADIRKVPKRADRYQREQSMVSELVGTSNLERTFAVGGPSCTSSNPPRKKSLAIPAGV